MTAPLRLNRRTLLAAVGGAGLAAATLGLSGCSDDSAGGGGSDLRMAWWGNDTRTALTDKVISNYEKAHQGVTVRGEPAEWVGYYDRLAVETAANNAPDLIQMDLKFLREYGDQGALLALDQAGLNTDDFPTDTLAPGRTDDGLMGVNAGVNAMFVAANPRVFSALGVDLPDDSSWTWDDYATVATKLSQKGAGKGILGSTDFTLYELGLWLHLRQQGKDLYTEEGIGFDADDAAEWFQYSLDLQKHKAIPDIDVAADDIVAALGDRLFTKGKTAMSFFWSNQVQSIEAAMGDKITMLRVPSTAGDVKQSKIFSNISMMWSIPARTKNKDAALAFVDFLVNDVKAAEVLKAERGMPANSKVAAAITPQLGASDQKAAKYLQLIKPDMTAPAPAPAKGLGDISVPQTRHLQDLRFGKVDVATAAKAYVDELNSLLG